MFLVWSCSCHCPIHWSQVFSREWRCSSSSADRRCSNYIWVINSFITYQDVTRAWLILVVWRYSCVLNIKKKHGKNCQKTNSKTLFLQISIETNKITHHFSSQHIRLWGQRLSNSLYIMFYSDASILWVVCYIGLQFSLTTLHDRGKAIIKFQVNLM